MFSRTVFHDVGLYVLQRSEILDIIPETVGEAKQYERPRKIGNYLYPSQKTSSLLVVAGYWPGETRLSFEQGWLQRVSHRYLAEILVKHICWAFQRFILRRDSPAGARVKTPHVSYLSFPFADSEASG